MEDIPKIHASRTEPLIIGKSTFRSTNDYILTDSDFKIAYNKFKETDQLRKSTLQKLKEKLKGDKINYRTDDEYLIRFIRTRKYNCDKAYSNMKEFYSTRTKYPEIFSLSNPLEKALNVDFFSYLPYTDDDGSPVLFVRFAKWDPEEVTFKELLSAACCVCDILSMNPHCQVIGCKGIWDANGITASHFTQVIRLLLYLVPFLQNCYPWKTNRLIIVNAGVVARTIYRCLRPFVKKKIADRIKFIGSDLTEIHQYINPEVIPKEYGGNLEESDYSVTQHVMNNLKYLEYERSFGAMLEE